MALTASFGFKYLTNFEFEDLISSMFPFCRGDLGNQNIIMNGILLKFLFADNKFATKPESYILLYWEISTAYHSSGIMFNTVESAISFGRAPVFRISRSTKLLHCLWVIVSK